MSNSRQAAEELASLAIRSIERFDEVFPSRVPNTCRCKIGGMTPGSINYNNLLDDLHRFSESFKTPVTDCEVNTFLGLSRHRGSTSKLLSDEGVMKLPLWKTLAKLRDENVWITCTECARIGDVIIALEQPRSWCLVHVDGSFNELSRCLEKDHIQLRSITALQNERAGAIS